MKSRKTYPSYFLPSVYLGSDTKAKRIRAEVKAMARLNPKHFKSQNDFLRYAVETALTTPGLVRPKRRSDGLAQGVPGRQKKRVQVAVQVA